MAYVHNPGPGISDPDPDLYPASRRIPPAQPGDYRSIDERAIAELNVAVARAKDTGLWRHPTACSMCEIIRTRHGGFGPSHDGSKRCESGSIASGGDNAHCTCDVCF